MRWSRFESLIKLNFINILFPETHNDSTAYTLRCIHPMIDYHMVLAKKIHIIDALKLGYNQTSLQVCSCRSQIKH